MRAPEALRAARYAAAAAGIALACTAALAQHMGLSTGQYSGEAPEWKESEVPPPPAFEPRRLIGIDSPRAGELKYGVDPATFTIQPDGVVRYVVVASSAGGASTALYEGVRCTTGDYKVYARHNAGSGWTPVAAAEWKPLFGDQRSPHTLSLARSGVCSGRSPNKSVDHIVRDLRSSPDLQFQR